MNTSRKRLVLCGCFLVLPWASAGAAERTPVQACAIIHATYVAKINAGQLKGVAKYCKKFDPFDVAASAVVRDKIAGGIAKRSNARGDSANKKLLKLGGEAVCDFDLQDDFDKPINFTTGDFAAYLDSQVQFCNDRVGF